MRPWRSALGLLLVVALGPGCGAPGEPPTAPRNLVLISVDTLRADHLGSYGYPRPTSPHIDALAAQGVVFEQAISTAPWTLPAHVSMLTGLYPSQHRVQDDGVRLDPSLPTLAERFAAGGFHTFAVVSHVYVASPFGIDRGFEVFDDALIEGGATNPRADAVVDRFIGLLDAHLERGGTAPAAAADGSGNGAGTPDSPTAAPRIDPAQPFFAFVHFYDPHWDYTPPPPYDRRFVEPGYAGRIDGSYESMKPFLHLGTTMPEADRAALVAMYDGEIAYLDEQLGRLLDALASRGLRGATAIAFSADHGEEFKEHKRLGHGRTLFEEQLRVPLVISGHPRLGRGRRPELVSLVDVTPTLLDLFDLAPIENAAGRSLAAPPTDDRVVFAESIRFGFDVRAARGPRHKLIDVRSNGWKLYFDLATDATEQRPEPDAGAGEALEAALDAYLASADSGWQLQLVAQQHPLRLRGRVRVGAGGRIVEPRHYFSGRVEGSTARFERFAVAADGRTLEIDVEIERHMGSIRFETEPWDAAIEFEIDELVGGALRVAGRVVDHASPLGFARGDEEVLRPLPRFVDLESGVHLRATRPARETAAPPLSEAARARLEALGYVDDD